MGNSRIFISYRREDSAGYAGRIFDRLKAHFPDAQIFMDVDTISPGDDFIVSIEKAVSSCDVFIALIGKQWVSIQDRQGNRRLDNPNDFVRIELTTALKRNIRVIPVLLHDTPMPRAEELPEDLAKLTRRNALEISHESFNDGINRLIAAVELGSQAADQPKPALEAPASSTSPKTPLYVAGGIGLVAIIGLILWAVIGGLGAGEDKEPTPIATSTIAVSEITDEPSLTPTTTAPPTTITPTSTKAPIDTPTPEPVVTRIIGDDEISVPMVLVPGGPFEMGGAAAQAQKACQDVLGAGHSDCELDVYQDEEPIHTVYLDDYYIDQHEVTNEQYAQFLNDFGNQSHEGVLWMDEDDPDIKIRQSGSKWRVEQGFENHPVIEITWYGAQAYCEENGARLPTEAEWEKAARGELTANKYPWGDQTPNCDLAHLRGCSPSSPITVESFAANKYDLYDMAGNVWEWVADWYAEDAYSLSAENNPLGPDSGVEKIIRGGGWGSYDFRLRVSQRFPIVPNESDNATGFRCARSTFP
jgi:formylglycine-generating enzyme required for sulfatase activity